MCAWQSMMSMPESIPPWEYYGFGGDNSKPGSGGYADARSAEAGDACALPLIGDVDDRVRGLQIFRRCPHADVSAFVRLGPDDR